MICIDLDLLEAGKMQFIENFIFLNNISLRLTIFLHVQIPNSCQIAGGIFTKLLGID